jgi:hypothetical protein
MMAISGGGPAMTEEGIALKLTTTGMACSVTGWAHVTGISRTAKVTAGRTTDSPALTIARVHPTRVVIGPGHPAYVLLLGSDINSQGNACPNPYRSYTLLLSHRRGRVTVAESPSDQRYLIMCGRFASTPFLPARDVIGKQR